MSRTSRMSAWICVNKNIQYDMSSTPRAADFDEPTYRQALHEANAAQIDLRCTVSKLHLVELEDEVLAWARGAIPTFPVEARARTTAQFDLSALELVLHRDHHNFHESAR